MTILLDGILQENSHLSTFSSFKLLQFLCFKLACISYSGAFGRISTYSICHIIFHQ